MVLFPPEVWDIIKQRLHHLLWLEAQKQHKLLMYYRYQSTISHCSPKRVHLWGVPAQFELDLCIHRFHEMNAKCAKCKTVSSSNRPNNSPLWICYCETDMACKHWQNIVRDINTSRRKNGKEDI